YVPKFYLRNFSYKNNQKQIGIYNLKSAFFHQTAKLKTQGSKNFFYGQDGIIENHLSDIEGLLASEIKNILSNQTLPSKNSAGHSTLLTFVGLTHLRNPTLIDYFRESREEMRRKLLEINKDINLDKFVPEIPHEIAVNMSLSVLKDVKNHIMDLNYKLLINKTEVSFISSDFPVVKYNQFLEKKKWNHGKTGYGNTGLQIFIPLNSKIILMLYDSTVYKVGFKKQPNLDISNKKDIDQLNILQILNSYSTLFFDEKI